MQPKNPYEIQDTSGQWSPYSGSGSGNIRSGGTTYSNYAGNQAYLNEINTPDPSAPTPSDLDPNAPTEIPTNPDGTQVSGGWDAGASEPNPVPGYHWDPTYAMYRPDASSGGGSGGSGGGGGSATPPPAQTAPPPAAAPPAQPSGGPAPVVTTPPVQQSGAQGASAPASSPAPIATVDPAVTAYNQSIRDALLRAINAPGVSMDDPDIAPAIQANRVQNQRALEQQREAIAERLNAQGISGSGTMDAQMAQAFQQTGERTGQFAGNALLQQAMARRQQLVSLLSTGSNVLTADEARQAQLKIADLDAYLRQQSITNQNQQANDQMGLTGSYYEALLKEQQIKDMLGL